MSRKTCTAALAGVLACLAGPQAFAAPPSAQVKVVGVFEVPGCNIDIAGTSRAVYDYQEISPTVIPAGTGTKALDSMAKVWTITCDGKTYLTYKVTDNRAGTESEVAANKFGLGNVNDDGKLGFYQVDMLEAKVRQNDVIKDAQVFATTNSSISNRPSEWLYSGNYVMGWAIGNVLAAGDMFQATFRVHPTLAGTTTMKGTIKEDTPLDGSLTLNFAFGL